MVLGIKKSRDFRSCDPGCTLPVQYRQDGGGREATDRIKEALASKGGYFLGIKRGVISPLGE